MKYFLNKNLLMVIINIIKILLIDFIMWINECGNKILKFLWK